MSKKIQLHTSFEERTKNHRNTSRKIGWGQGLTEGVPFTKDLLRPNFWGMWLGIGLWILVVKLLPWSVLMSLGRCVGKLMHRFMKSRVYVVQRNIELAFPEKTPEEKVQLEKDIFLNAGMALFETGVAWFWSDERFKKLLHVDPEQLEKARKLAASDPRMIVLSSHLVTLEGCARSYALLIKPGMGVYRSSDHPVWEYIQVKYRLRSNIALIDRKDVRSMVKCISQRTPLWYQPDQDFGPQVSIFVPFFAVKNAATVQGLHDLARIKECIVQPYWMTRVKNGYEIHILDPLENYPTADAVADTARCNQIIEQMVRSDIAQYLWMHRRFKTAPEGEPKRYPDIE